MEKTRCKWVGKEQIYIDYHDQEWGRPVFESQKLFQKFVLDSFQAGLSWITILKKRENFIAAFDNFNPEKIATYDNKKVEELMQNSGIIRNRLKINATISNAQAFLKLEEKEGGFSDFLWQFVNHQPIVNKWTSMSQIPPNSQESDNMSKAMKKLGFKFCGTTICYAFMQAVGMINDHTEDCFCKNEILNRYE